MFVSTWRVVSRIFTPMRMCCYMYPYFLCLWNTHFLWWYQVQIGSAYFISLVCVLCVFRWLLYQQSCRSKKWRFCEVLSNKKSSRSCPGLSLLFCTSKIIVWQGLEFWLLSVSILSSVDFSLCIFLHFRVVHLCTSFNTCPFLALYLY